MFERYIEISQNGFSKKEIPKNKNLYKYHGQELHDIILGRYVDIALDRMEQDGVLIHLIPGLSGVTAMKDSKKRFKDLWDHTLTVILQSKPTLEIRWAALFHDFGKPECFSMADNKVSFYQHEQASVKYFKEFARRFKIFTPEEYNKISFLIYNLGYVESYDSSWSDAAVRRFTVKVGNNIDDLLLLSRADITSSRPDRRAKIQKTISSFKRRIKELQLKDSVVPPLPKGIGTSIMEHFNVQSGVMVGHIKQYLESGIEKKSILPNQTIDYYIDYLKSHMEIGINSFTMQNSKKELIYDAEMLCNKVLQTGYIEAWQRIKNGEFEGTPFADELGQLMYLIGENDIGFIEDKSSE